MAANTSETYTIGYALAPKKQSSFIQPSLLQHACEKSMTLVPIDPLIPLVNQGPFDCVIHKLSGSDWMSQLDEFAKVYPDVPIIDSLDSIERLHNRISMLEVVNQLKENEEKVLVEKSGTLEEKCEKTETFGVPKQVVIESLEGLENLDELELCIGFPMIAKPLVADGSVKSHKMSLIFNREGLKKLKPNTVLQEFVNHGGVIFKVYVVGNYVKCVKRKSLADISEEKLQKTLEASMSFSQVSNLTASNYNHGSIDEDIFQNVDMPPLSFLTDLAVGLRKVLGLNLFNFDVIRDVKVGNRYLVIDINYFPGYAKMPDYESVLTDFFWDVVQKKKEGEDLVDDKGNN